MRTLAQRFGIVSMLATIYFGSLCCHGDERTRPFNGDAPAKSYELQYLGCSIKEDPTTHTHEGHFLFIWNGEEPTKVRAYLSPKNDAFFPFPSFGVHYATGWRAISPWCGTGAHWRTIQPGEVIPFNIGMEWVEHNPPGYPSLEGADRARFQISSLDGRLVSEEFSLPLINNRSK